MEPKTGDIYCHFKAPEKRYEIVGVALNTETEEPMVVYRRLYEADLPELFARPLVMFVETVDKPEYGYRGPRFIRASAA